MAAYVNQHERELLHETLSELAEVDVPILAPVVPSVMVAFTVTLLAALPWFATSAEVCMVALSATREMRPASSVTLFVPLMSAA